MNLFATIRPVVIAVLLMATAGCASVRWTRCVEPQVNGRVLAADTQRPIVGASVRRSGSEHFQPFGPPKGGQLMQESRGVVTDADGRFKLSGEYVVGVFWKPTRWSVPLVVEAPGYRSLETNYAGAPTPDSSAAAEPVVDAGDLLLQPVAR